MKLHKQLAVISLGLFLAACSDDTIEESKTRVADVEVAADSVEIEGNHPLENIGEFQFTDMGRIELLNIIEPADTYLFTDGVDLDFNTIKILHHSEIPKDAKELHHHLYGFDDEGYSIQFTYTVTNGTEQTIGGIEIKEILTADGSRYNLFENQDYAFAAGNSAYEVLANETAHVDITFAVDSPDTNRLELYFQPFDEAGWHLEESSINLSF